MVFMEGSHHQSSTSGLLFNSRRFTTHPSKRPNER